MKNILLKSLTVAVMTIAPIFTSGQAPTLGSSTNFALFSTNGSLLNSGISHITGEVGTNNGSNTGFGNVNGGMHSADGVSAQCATDLLIAYNQLDATVPTNFPAPGLGNGQILAAGVYSISGASTITLDLILDAQNNQNAVFIFQIAGPLSTAPNAKVKLINGALACNVFWKVEGLVSMAAGTSMKGTVIANNAAINMNSGDTLEGRALSTTGAVTIDGVFVYLPTGCGSLVLTGPPAPNLATTECYAIFSSNGAVSNTGITYATGDVGTNVGLTTGFNAANVVGTIHPIPDASTATCAADLSVVYAYLNTLPTDIELIFPAQLGNDLVLTPHTYLLNAATILTDTLYLDARGNTNSVFVIKVNGAFSTSTYSKVLLINGAQGMNVYWKIDGAYSLNDYSVFEGTVVCNNGAVNLNTGVTLNGRVLTTTGMLSTAAVNVTAPSIPPSCAPMGIESNSSDSYVLIYPNPFGAAIQIALESNSVFEKADLVIYNTLGEVIVYAPITKKTGSVDTGKLTNSLYFYRVIANGNVIQSGKLVSQK